MRWHILIYPLAAALSVAPALAQDEAQPSSAPSASAAPAAAPRSADAGELVEQAARFATRSPWFPIPEAKPAAAGARTVAAGERVVGNVAVAQGTLDVYGTIDGDAVSYGGDIVVHEGGLVTGDAVAVLGRVRLDGGTVRGEMRSVRGSLTTPSAPVATAASTMRSRLGLVAGWFAVLALMGVGVLVFAGGPLEGVVERLERDIGASLLAGIAGQLALAPVLLLLLIALAVTVVGVLLIPFAIVGYVVAAAGLMTLGFLAVARIVGGALTGRAARSRLSPRGAALRGVLVGVVCVMALWLLAVLLGPFPRVSPVARGIAFALTWVAVTAGFGAALLSRAGTRRQQESREEPGVVEEEISWQTPTPIGGVAAARRPTSAVR
ncbi:MAG TPA: hypothetical protein VFS08_18380 [Gemmatimonadaceae bacterium]|nr:hypothetical protein [Gemmatimonadaceae bacterium]